MKPKYMRADFPNLRYNRTSHERRVIYTTEEKMVEALGYLVAHSLRECRLEIYALCLFFNHEHGDLAHPIVDATPETRARYSDFYELFHSLGFQLLKKCGWKHGPVYSRIERTHDAPSLDPDQILDDLVYDTAQAVKAGLYARSSDYPGLCLLPENVTKPRVFRRNSLIDLIDPDGVRFPDKELSIQLGVPEPFRELGREGYQELFQSRLEAYEDEHRNPRASKIRGDKACAAATLGKRFEKYIRRLRTRGKLPPTTSSSPPPPYTSIPEIRRAYLAERRSFWSEHAEALRELRDGESSVVFPAGTYGRARNLNVPVSCNGPPCWKQLPRWSPG